MTTVTFNRNVQTVTFTSATTPGVTWQTVVGGTWEAPAGGTGDGAATVDAVALTNFTVSTLTLSALNASISSTVAVNDTVLIPGGADAGTYTVTQSGAPCLTVIDPQPTTVRVNDVSSGAVWYVLVGTVWVPHATVQQLAEVDDGSERIVDAVCDGTGEEVGTITALTVLADGRISHTLVRTSAATETLRAAILLPYDPDLRDGELVRVEGVPGFGTTHGPSVGQESPPLPAALSIDVGDLDPGVYVINETMTVTRNGVATVLTFNDDYVDFGGWVGALAAALDGLSGSSLVNAYSDALTNTVYSVALVHDTPGSAGTLTISATGALTALAAAFNVHLGYDAADWVLAPNYKELSLDGLGDFDPDQFGAPTHAWSDDGNSLLLQAAYRWSEPDLCWYTAHRKVRPEEMSLYVADEADWSPVPGDVRSALDQLAARSGGGASLSDDAPEDVGTTAAAGVSTEAARSDHVHDVATNTANGLVRLNGSAIIPPILIDDTIARDTEVTAAVEALGVEIADALADYLAAANNLSDVPTPATARTNLGLAIGSNVQGYSDVLTALVANGTPGALGAALLLAASAAAARTTLGLGTAALSASGDFQPADADLTAIAALTTTSYGRSLLAAADAAALRTLAVTPWYSVYNADINVATGSPQSVTIPSTARAIRAKFIGRSARAATTDTMIIRFNSDSTATAYSTNGGAVAAQIAATLLTGSLTNTDRSSDVDITVGCGQSATSGVKMSSAYVQSTGTVSVGSGLLHGSYDGTKTTPITSMQFSAGNANLIGRLFVEVME